LLISVSLKVRAIPLAADPQARVAELHRFLTTNRADSIEGVPIGQSGPPWGGWRFRVGDCRAALFPSSSRESQDLFAHNRAGRGDRMEYAYRGRLRPVRPTWPLAIDLIAYRLAAPFRSGSEPGYAVVTYSSSCAGPPDLPWTQLPVT
jgi:hypothetical protein